MFTCSSVVVPGRKWKGPLRMIQDAANLLLSVKSLGVEQELGALYLVTQSFACFVATCTFGREQLKKSTYI